MMGIKKNFAGVLAGRSVSAALRLCASAFLFPCLIMLFALPATAEAQTSRKQAANQSTRQATGSLKVITGKPYSYVFINNVLHGATKENGELNLPRVWTGSYRVLIRAAGFTDWNGTIIISANAKRELKVTQKPTADQSLIHYQKGEELRYRGKSREAVEEYAKALALRAAFPEAHIGMARCFITQQDYQRAEESVQLAMKSAGRVRAEAQTVLANLRRNQGITDEAIDEYKKALQLARNVSAEAHIGLGLAYKDANMIDEAIKEYYTGLRQDMDTEPILYYHLAEMLESENRYKEAIEAYSNYIRLDPEGEFASAAESIIERLKEEIK